MTMSRVLISAVNQKNKLTSVNVESIDKILIHNLNITRLSI